MNKWRMWGRFLAAVTLISCVILLFNYPANADNGEGERYKTVETTYTVYTWQMMDYRTNKKICEVMVNHPGLPTQMEALTACSIRMSGAFYPSPTPIETQRPGFPTPTPQYTATPIDMPKILEEVYWILISTRQVTQTIKIPLPPIIVNIHAPSNLVQSPYVTIKAYEPATDYKITGIHGFVQGRLFECPGDICDVPITRDVDIVYWATSSFGDDSRHYDGVVRIAQTESGYLVSVTSANFASLYIDSCSRIWGNFVALGSPEWLDLPTTPDGLRTSKTLHYLAGQLIKNGIVDASACPGNGLFIDGSPNACGLEKARPAMLEWQNRFDPIIWSSAREFGVPAKMIKSLIEQESQFWPGNSRFFELEYGLGQISELGADAALRWDPVLNNQVCNGLLYDCGFQYGSLTDYPQAIMRGGLIQQMNAECPECKFGINIAKAEMSVRLIAQILRSNCWQTRVILENNQLTTNYNDAWKFTLTSYHSGYQCLEDGLKKVKSYNDPTDWNHFSRFIGECDGTGKGYVDSIWQKLSAYSPVQPTLAIGNIPTFVPTETRLAPTPIGPKLVNGKISVMIYGATEDKTVPISDIDVNVQFADGSTRTQKITDGQASISFVGQPVGSDVLVTVPYLYRSYIVSIPESGEIYIIFRLETPVLPPRLP